MASIKEMSSAALAQLISAASAELARRADATLMAAATARPQDAPALHVTVKPAEDDADFVLYVKSKLQSGGYITADERRRVAEIAKTHGAWVRRQGLPTEHNTGPWRKAAEYMARPRAAAR